MSRCVVVLGMHRSGTSCITRMLHHLGVYLGENIDDDPAPTNLIGHWEARDVVTVNDQILALSGGAWDRVPERLTWDVVCTEKVQRIIADFAMRPVFGWKDPRTTITFPAWQEHLPDYTVLACIRHPLAVAESLQVRDGFDIERGLRLWTAYNQHLLQHLSREREVLWFPYDEPQQARRDHLLRLCNRLQLPFRDDVVELFNPYLRHCRASDHPAAAEAIELYETLLGMSRNCLSVDKRVAMGSQALAATIAAAEPTTADLIEATVRERNLQEVLRNFSAAQQGYWRVIYENQRITSENIERNVEVKLAQGIERATLDRDLIAALEERLACETERVTVEQHRVVALEERLAHEIERVRIEGQRITALEERLARAEAALARSPAVQLLASVPGVRPMYRMARHVLHAGR